MPVATLTDAVRSHGDRVALVDAEGPVTYRDLVAGAEARATQLAALVGPDPEARVVLLVEPSRTYVEALLAVWSVGAVAVPVKPGVPGPEIAYVLDDAEPAAVVASAACRPAVAELAEARRIPLVAAEGSPAPGTVPTLRPPPPPGAAALMLYTSGTTGRPKGVVHTHASLAAQVRGLVAAWGWGADDRILLTLPLHHVHGLVNVVSCALWTGATCDVLDGFDAATVWDRLGELTVYMAVPTIYRRLIDTWDGADEPTRTRWSAGAAGLRLMVSGSAALPLGTLRRWEEITGQVLLERYGMTEIGMALSNTLDRRQPGRVGWPLPGVEVRVVDEALTDISPGPGELLVRSPNLFREYWQRPEATDASFHDGWFRTGDVVEVDEAGSYRILGRASVDILKSGGEKVSALEVEEVLRTHEAVADCAVVGVEDEDWGQRICAAVVLVPEADLGSMDLRRWAKGVLADHKVPRTFRAVADLPRNAMGKVVKPEVAKMFASLASPTAEGEGEPGGAVPLRGGPAR